MMRLHSFDIIDAAAIRIPIRERRGVVWWNASCYLMLKFLAILARFFLLSIPLLWSNLFLSLGESSQERMGGPSMLGTQLGRLGNNSPPTWRHCLYTREYSMSQWQTLLLC